MYEFKFRSTPVQGPTNYVFKALASCTLLEPSYRIFAYKVLEQGSPKEEQSSCYETIRCRGYVSDYGVSRLVFKNYAMCGYYSGLKKFVW